MTRGRSFQRCQRSCVFPLGLALLVWFFVLPGCSRSSLPPGPKGTVQGKVTYKGSPVPAGSIIMFVHEQTSLAGTGEVSADGTYELTMQGGVRVPTGKYAISVNAPVSVELSQETDMEAYKAIMEGSAAAPPPADPFPRKYQVAETSGVTFEVAEGANTLDLDMTDDP